MTLKNKLFTVGRAGHDPATYGLKGRDPMRRNLARPKGDSAIAERGVNHACTNSSFYGVFDSDTDPLSPLRRWTAGAS